MSKDLSKALDALRIISTKLEKKEDVDPALWAETTLKAGTRLKDVQKEITKLKKVVSQQTKADNADDEEDEEGGPDGRGGRRQDQREKKDVRKHGADKKNATHAMARGEFNLGGDQLFVADDGEVRQAA